MTTVAVKGAASAVGHLLVLGGGYTGQRLARSAAAQGIPVTLTHRQPEAPPPLAPGCRWLRFDPASGHSPEEDALADVTHAVVTIPPTASGEDPALVHLGPCLQRLGLAWLGYLSTTGVYGDHQGAWVHEDTPVGPNQERSRRRLAAEEGWRRLGLPLQVFRLPAIYGPSRSPFADLRAGRARLIHKPGQVFCRIHVDDIVGALWHNLMRGATERPDTLILADTLPCPSSETLGYAAHLLGVRLPPLQSFANLEPTLSPMARSFWSENRRVSSALLREGLGYVLRYPTYREGYRACLAEEEAAGRDASGS